MARHMAIFALCLPRMGLGVMLCMLRRPGFLQLSLLFNSVFILCIFLVAAVTCLFSPELKPFINSPERITIIVFLFIGGAAFSLYYLTVVNSLYRKMKMLFSDSGYPM